MTPPDTLNSCRENDTGLDDFSLLEHMDQDTIAVGQAEECF